MSDTALVSFPLPMATAFLCGVIALLVWRLDLGLRRSNAFFSAFFALGAIASTLVGLRFGYGVEDLIPLQRTLPLFFGPMMYLGFAALAVERQRFARLLLWHIGIPALLTLVFSIGALDIRNIDGVISGSYAVYVLALFLLWRKGPDVLINARVDVAENLSIWMFRGTVFLFFILALDSVVAVDFAINEGDNAARLISFGTFPLVGVLLAAIVALPLIFVRAPSGARHEDNTNGEDSKIAADFQRLMHEHQLFLDPDITVQRLARRLSLPARVLSGAINRTQQQNMSQYINTFRLAYAAQQLSETKESVTKIAMRSGFTARSNFYREFQRVYGQSPTEYRSSKFR